jgi:glycerol kinase
MQPSFLKNISAKPDHFLILDVGTTGIKAFVFDANFKIKTKTYRPLKTRRPKKDWVEQDPMEILRIAKGVLQEAAQASRVRLNYFAAFGLANQRETVVAWDRVTGKPIYPAVVWEDRRGGGTTRALKGVKGIETLVKNKTGLLLDPYFSATKIEWLLENVPLATKLLASNRLLVGTLDTWLLWNLCEGQPFLTDETNASRTLLFNIKKRVWDNELLNLFDIPKNILPKVFSSGAMFGFLKTELIGARLPVLAVVGDQQAGAYAAGTKKGTTKVTYGTGAFLVQSLGNKFSLAPGFFTTLLPTLNGCPIFAVEAKVENCAAVIEPVLNNPKKLKTVLTKIAHKVNIAIKKLPAKPKELVVDGGVARDGIIVSLQQKISNIPVRPQKVFDGTALGVVELVSKVLKKKYVKKRR